MMSFRFNPTALALEVELLRVECAGNAVMSIPASPKNNFTYLQTVLEVTGPKGAW